MNIEPLESRIAPAAVLTYIDTDGDSVKISTSKGTHDLLVAAAHFTGAAGGPQQLTELDVNTTDFIGTTVSITVTKKAMNGNGTVDVGFINGAGQALGAVTVQGDLGRISAGANAPTGLALASLTLGSLGVKGAAGGSASTASSILGGVGAVKTTGDFAGSFLVADTVDATAKIASISIGGSLTGVTVGSAGYIQAGGFIGSVTIAHDLKGGSSSDTGKIYAELGIGNVTIMGSLIGGQAQSSGVIETINGAPMGMVKIMHDIVADPGNYLASALIEASGFLKGVYVGGSVTGGGGQSSGEISVGAGAGLITIHGSLQGGPTRGTGSIIVIAGDLAGVTIGGNLIGGGGQDSGAINSAATIGPVTVTGYLQGGAGIQSGSIVGKTLKSVTINGKLPGITTFGVSAIADISGNGGAVLAGTGGLGTLKIAGDLLSSFSINGPATSVTIGGSIARTAAHTGQIYLLDTKLIRVVHDIAGSIFNNHGTVASLVVGGSMIGTDVNTGTFYGNGNDSFLTKATIAGSIIGNANLYTGVIEALGGIGSVSIAHDLTAGDSTASGEVTTNGHIGSVTIGGSLIGKGLLSDTSGDNGAIIAGTGIDKISIAHDLQGGNAAHSGWISAGLGTAKLGSLTIGGSVFGDDGEGSGSIIAGSLGVIVIKKDLEGGTADRAGSIIASTGSITSVAITGEVKGGSATSTGYINSIAGDVGPVSIGKDLLGGGASFTGEIDAHGKLGAVTIKGNVLGGSSDESGSILARNGSIGAVKIGKDLEGSNFNDNFAHGTVGAIVSAGDITSISLGGNLFARTNFGSGSIKDDGAIVSGGNIGAVTIAKDVKGVLDVVHDGILNPAFIAAKGSVANPVAIKSISIGGSVSAGLIAAGYSDQGNSANGDASLGPVTVKGSWAESSAIAGVRNNAGSANYSFGSATDALISGGNAAVIAKIASITIGGHVTGSALNATDHFGFVAEQVGAVKIAGHAVTLDPNPHTGNVLVDGTTDVSVHEV